MFFFWIPYYKETAKLASEVPSDRSRATNIVQVHWIYTQQFQGPQHTGKIRVSTEGWSKNMFQNGSLHIKTQPRHVLDQYPKKAKTRLKLSFKPHVQLFILGLMRLRTFYLRRCVCCGDAHLAWRGIGMIIVMIYDWCCASYDYEWVLLATVIHLINR